MCRNHSHIVADHIAVLWAKRGRLDVLRIPRRMEVQQPSGPAWMLKPGSLLVVPSSTLGTCSALTQALTEGSFTCLCFNPVDGMTATLETLPNLTPSYTPGWDSYDDGDTSPLTEGELNDVPF